MFKFKEQETQEDLQRRKERWKNGSNSYFSEDNFNYGIVKTETRRIEVRPTEDLINTKASSKILFRDTSDLASEEHGKVELKPPSPYSSDHGRSHISERQDGGRHESYRGWGRRVYKSYRSHHYDDRSSSYHVTNDNRPDKYAIFEFGRNYQYQPRFSFPSDHGRSNRSGRQDGGGHGEFRSWDRGVYERDGSFYNPNSTSSGREHLESSSDHKSLHISGRQDGGGDEGSRRRNRDVYEGEENYSHDRSASRKNDMDYQSKSAREQGQISRQERLEANIQRSTQLTEKLGELNDEIRDLKSKTLEKMGIRTELEDELRVVNAAISNAHRRQARSLQRSSAHYERRRAQSFNFIPTLDYSKKRRIS